MRCLLAHAMLIDPSTARPVPSASWRVDAKTGRNWWSKNARPHPAATAKTSTAAMSSERFGEVGAQACAIRAEPDVAVDDHARRLACGGPEHGLDAGELAAIEAAGLVGKDGGDALGHLAGWLGVAPGMEEDRGGGGRGVFVVDVDTDQHRRE